MTIPGGVRKVIVPLLILFIFGVSWFGLYKPELAKISEYRKQPAANRQQIESLVRQLSEYDPPTQEEREQWRNLEEQISLRLPSGKNITELYSLLSRLAVENDCRQFTRQELANTDTTYTTEAIPRRGFDMQLDFECDYRDLKSYLDGLKQAERLIEIVRVTVDRGLPLLKVQMVIRSYYSPSVG